MAFAQNYFTGMIDESGTIWDLAAGRKQTAIGIDNQRENEYKTTIADLQEVVDNYYNKLVELGVIQKQKTAEEIQQEIIDNQNNLLKDMMNSLAEVKNELKELKKNGDNGKSDKSGSPRTRKKSEANEPSNCERQTDDSGNAG